MDAYAFAERLVLAAGCMVAILYGATLVATIIAEAYLGGMEWRSSLLLVLRGVVATFAALFWLLCSVVMLTGLLRL